MQRPAPRLVLSALVAIFMTLGACSPDDPLLQDPDEADAQEQAIEDAIRASVEAENAGDVDAFLALWTDRGLQEYDAGSRAELEAGESEVFGSDQITILGFDETMIIQDQGSSIVDATVGESQIATPIYRVRFAAVQQNGNWLLDGFEFLGSPPPSADQTVLEIEGNEYAFTLNETEVPGDVAFRFSNTGDEPHEIALFKGPDGVEVGTARSDLENLDGETLQNLPEGYQADHVSFVQPGDAADITFAEPLEPGSYVLVCYLPQGGFTEEGEPVDPDGAPHVQLGMINTFTVN